MRTKELRDAADKLKSASAFTTLMELLRAELADVRAAYESTQPASEFLRGRVCQLRDLLEDLTDSPR